MAQEYNSFSAEYGQSEETKQIVGRRSDEFSRKSIGELRSLHQTKIPSLPSYQLNLPLSFTQKKIKLIFKTTSKSQEFSVSNQDSKSMTVVHQRKTSFKDLFSCFASEDRRAKNASAVKLQIETNQRTCTQVLSIRGLYGFPHKINSLVQEFKEAIQKELSFAEGIENMRFSKISDIEDEPAVTSKVENYSYYEFYKVLSSEEYGVGKSLSEFIKEFKENYTAETFESLPEPLEHINQVVESTVNSISSYFNLGTSNNRILNYCRPAVEKYLYSKLLSGVLSMYSMKHSEINNKFNLQKEKLQSKSTQEVMDILEIKDKFRLQGTHNPYEESIEALNSLEAHHSPLEKLNSILECMTLMKTVVVDYWKGKKELEAMDDQLPVIIFIVSQVTSQEFPSEIRFLLDYSSMCSGFDNEQRLLVNIDASVSYITKEINL